ncbi:hypothetical protein V8C34DRAFT_273259 [Trichoderma compactum]
MLVYIATVFLLRVNWIFFSSSGCLSCLPSSTDYWELGPNSFWRLVSSSPQSSCSKNHGVGRLAVEWSLSSPIQGPFPLLFGAYACCGWVVRAWSTRQEPVRAGGRVDSYM